MLVNVCSFLQLYSYWRFLSFFSECHGKINFPKDLERHLLGIICSKARWLLYFIESKMCKCVCVCVYIHILTFLESRCTVQLGVVYSCNGGVVCRRLPLPASQTWWNRALREGPWCSGVVGSGLIRDRGLRTEPGWVWVPPGPSAGGLGQWLALSEPRFPE